MTLYWLMERCIVGVSVADHIKWSGGSTNVWWNHVNLFCA